MVLSNVTINKLLSEGKLVIRPTPKKEFISGASVDVRLHNVFFLLKRIRRTHIDISQPINAADYLEEVEIPFGSSLILHPGEFLLALTFEWIELPNNIQGKLEGRSSLGRIGVIVHATSGKLDPGFRGRVAFELSNMGRVPITLYPMMRVGSIELFHTDKVAKRYKGKYANQLLEAGTKIFEDKEINEIKSARF